MRFFYEINETFFVINYQIYFFMVFDLLQVFIIFLKLIYY